MATKKNIKKGCLSCVYYEVANHKEPCKSCDYYSKWKDKDEEKTK